MNFLFTVISGANIINSICDDHDGCNCRYCSSIRGGRYRITICHFLDIVNKFIPHSRLFTSARVLVYCTWYYLLALYTFNVLAFDFVLRHKPERSIMGNSRGTGEKNEEGKYNDFLLNFGNKIYFVL